MAVISTLEVLINGNNASLRAALSDSDRLLDNHERGWGDRLRRIGDGMTRLGGQISLMTAPLVAFGVQGISVASDFEGVMAEIGARAGLTAEELGTVRDVALQLGADTAFSAQQAADSFLQLLTSGQSVEEALATLPSVLDAAAASGEDLGRTADGVTDILAAFRLPVDRSANVVDSLARAAGASSADMSDLFESFANVGGVAAQFGLTVEETAAILAIFAENGVKGAEAGTQLKSMLLNMSRDTDDVAEAWDDFGSSLYDQNGALRPIALVLEEIEQAQRDMTAEEIQTAMQNLAGSYGILGLTALTTGMDMEDMLFRMDESASASDVAAARTDTFAGRVDALKGSVETLMIEAMTPFMNDVLAPLADDLTIVINQITAWTKENPEATKTIIGIVGALTLFGVVLIPVGMALSAVGTIIGTVGTAVGLLKGGVLLLMSTALAPLLPLIIVIGGLFLAYTHNILGFKDMVDAAAKAVQQLVYILTQLPNAPQVVANAVNAELQAGSFQMGTGQGRQNAAAALFGRVGGMRAEGGPVLGGMSYIVGERGPELFTPGRSGGITPNDQLRAGVGGGPTYNITVMMPPDALRDSATAARRGREFGDSFMNRMRERG